MKLTNVDITVMDYTAASCVTTINLYQYKGKIFTNCLFIVWTLHALKISLYGSSIRCYILYTYQYSSHPVRDTGVHFHRILSSHRDI